MAKANKTTHDIEQDVVVGPIDLPGKLILPENAVGLVIFAHGSGSSRLSKRNQMVAEFLRRVGIGTLLFDLLQAEEAESRDNVFDIEMLADRLCAARQWLSSLPYLHKVPLAYFGASTGAAAALLAAAREPDHIKAVVSRGGRPDLAGSALSKVKAPTLLIVGGEDEYVVELNLNAIAQLKCSKSLEVISGASHLFPEPDALERVAWLSADWFAKSFRKGVRRSPLIAVKTDCSSGATGMPTYNER